MQEQTRENLTNRNIWARGAYMVFFLIAHAVAETLWVLIAIVQFVLALVSGKINPALHNFGGNVARYVFQITQFQTFNSELTPYPFADWPEDENDNSIWSRQPHDTDEPAAAAADREPAQPGVEPSAQAEESDESTPKQ